MNQGFIEPLGLTMLSLHNFEEAEIMFMFIFRHFVYQNCEVLCLSHFLQHWWIKHPQFKTRVYFSSWLQKFQSMIGRLKGRNGMVEGWAREESCSRHGARSREIREADTAFQIMLQWPFFNEPSPPNSKSAIVLQNPGRSWIPHLWKHEDLGNIFNLNHTILSLLACR